MQTQTPKPTARLKALAFEDIEPFLDAYEVTGIQDVTGLDRIGIPVVTVTRPNSPTISINSGKGLTMDDAIVSGCMEAIEIAVAEQFSGNPISATWFEITRAGERVIPLKDIQRAKDSIFNPMLPFSWDQMLDLKGEKTYVPAVQVGMKIYCGYGHLLPFQVGSNGLASGGCFEDALLSGVYEVIERDAWSIANLRLKAGKPMRKVRLESIQSDAVNGLIDRLKSAGIELHIFDCSLEVAKVYGAYIADAEDASNGVFLGFGCNLNPEIAAIRAITEACQGRLCYISGARDDMFRRSFEILRRSKGARDILNSLPETDDFDNSDHPDVDPSDPFRDVKAIHEKLEKLGHSILYRELNPEEKAFSVVRVMIPGFEGHNFDYYAPGYRAIQYISR